MKEKYYQTVDEFNAAVQKQAEEKVKDEMIVYYIARQEKMAITDSVYSEKALEIAQDEGYGDLDMYIAYRAYSLGYLTTDEEVTDEIRPVSYTHLDVYKRQVLYGICGGPPGIRAGGHLRR